MKKLCLLLALALALSTMPALAAQGDMVLGREEGNNLYFNYVFPVGDTLYLAYGQSMFYSYRAGETALTEHTIAQPERQGYASNDMLPFAADGELYAINLVSSYGEHSQFEGAELLRLAPDGDNFTSEKVMDLDWSDLVEYYDEDSFATRPFGLLGVGKKAVFSAYDQQGDTYLYAVDLYGGGVSQIAELRGAYGFTLYRDDTLLVELYDYASPGEARLVAYDPEAEVVETLTDLEIADYSPLTGLAYDFDTDTVYCAKGGELCPVDLQSGEVGEGVTDMPLETYNNSPAFVLEGGYYVFGSDGLAVRNLDPGQRAQTRLKINDSDWSESISNAYYQFSNAHGDVSAILSRDWSEAQNLLENMMNHDDSIDIYVLPSSSNIYDALYKRGYLMELDGSEKLEALAESMYPSIREAVSTDGHLVALPIDFSSWTFGVNEQALEALGLTLADVPDNWMDFMDFLMGLEEPLSEHANIHLFYSGYTDREARNDLFNSLFEDYQRYVNVVNPSAGYNSPLLRDLLGKLEQIDFAALGCPEASGDEDDESHISYAEILDYDENSILLQTGVGNTFGSFYGTFTPLLLGLDADTPMPLVLRASLAFVNPYTKNPEMALAFMETLADHLSTGARYTLDPTLNEPVRGAQNAQNLADAKEMLANAQIQLDEADEADRQMLEENLRNLQQACDYWEEYGWEVSQREIDWFRGHDDDIVLDRVNWLYADDSGDAWDLISQYLDGAIGIDEMLSAIDRKAQMMMLEGN